MSRPSRALLTLVGVLSLAVLAAAVVSLVRDRGLPSLLRNEGCRVETGDHVVEVSLEQAENAALITALSVQRGMPARAASIALATAYQESGLRNIDHGDRDSIGLFQQRPSQGWGTREQILDPVYATTRFYDALDLVEGYESMEVTVAAQTVQRSAFPDAYADHEADARALASALTGNSRAAFWCTLTDGPEEESDALDDAGLTARAASARADLEATFGSLPVGGFEPGGVTTGHMPGSAHYDGRAVDVFFRPISPQSKKRGWAVASYLMGNADRLGIATLIFDDRVWRADRSDEGWRDYEVPSSSRGDRRILEHRDHVHLDVFG